MFDALPGLSPRHPIVYALNFAPEEQRQTLAGIWQLTQELDGLSRIAESDVAAVKLPWWHEELARWQQHGARHPATRALSSLAGRSRVDAAVRQLLAATAVQQTSPRCGAEADFWDRCEQHALGLGVVAAYLDADEVVSAGYRSVGAAALGLERLLTAAPEARAGRILLPLELVAEAGLDSRKLAEENQGEAFISIRQHLATAARQRLVAGRAGINAAPAPAQHRYALVLAALYDALSRRLASRKPASHRPASLRQLWIAWRAAWRANRCGA